MRCGRSCGRLRLCDRRAVDVDVDMDVVLVGRLLLSTTGARQEGHYLWPSSASRSLGRTMMVCVAVQSLAAVLEMVTPRWAAG